MGFWLNRCCFIVPGRRPVPRYNRSMIRVCFVCLGNICRSPTAEGALRHLVQTGGLEAEIEVDSAGTAGYHSGEPPDPRAVAAGLRRGIEVGGRARQFRTQDFERFDYIVAMDRSNLEGLMALAPGAAQRKVSLLRSFDPQSPAGASVPDPYHGGDAEFDAVVDTCLNACRGLLEQIRREHGF